VHDLFCEGALRALDVEVVRPKGVEDGAELLQVCGPGNTIDENVVKETRTHRRRNGLRMKFMSAWNVDGAFERPNGMTRNSNWPRCVRNAVLATSLGCTRTWW
jgi:hypothetical protein